MSAVKEEPAAENMADATMSNSTVEVTEADWDEARLEAALAQLQAMYRQVRELRSAIPNLIAPLTVKQPSPEIMHRKMAKAIKSANEDVRSFRQLMDDESSKKIFEHARESRAKNPKGIKPFKITDHPDWYEKKP